MHDRISELPPSMSPISEPPLPELGLDEFVSEEQLALLIQRDHAVRRGCILHARNGVMYVMREAVRVLGNVSHETDPYGFIGRVESIGEMLKRGFVMSAERIALGRAVYDVEYGFIIDPIGNGSADASGVNPKVG